MKMTLNWKCLAMLYLVVGGVSSTPSTQFEVQKSEDSEVARSQLQKIYQQAKHMRYGKCWTKALEVLQAGCRNLSDETQRRIAYAFARCHLLSAGRDIPECDPDMAISECASEERLNDAAFNSYTEFFTHTQQICFHLQSQVWHEATENTISRLADNSEEVATTLEKSSAIAQEMVERQNVTLQNQAEMLKNEQLLRENMQKSVLDVQRQHEETKGIIREQRALFAEVFDRVAVLQKTVLGEFTSVYTFGFYVGASLLAYILTSSHRSSSARFWLLMLLSLNFLTERCIVSYHMASEQVDGIPESTVLPEPLYRDLWLCRKTYSAISFLVMIICIIRYKDYNKINNELLNEIKLQNKELQELLKEQGINSFHNQSVTHTPKKGHNGDLVPVAKHSDIVSSSTTHSQVLQVDDQLITTLTSNVADSSYATNASMMNSLLMSDDDDHTFVPEDSASESSYSSYMTGSSRRSSSLGGEDTVASMIRSFRRSSTPHREFESPRSASGGRRRSRRSSVSSDISVTEQLNESVSHAQGIIIGGHNLRKRRSTQNLNPILERESARDFAKAVAQMTINRRRILNHTSH